MISETFIEKMKYLHDKDYVLFEDNMILTGPNNYKIVSHQHDIDHHQISVVLDPGEHIKRFYKTYIFIVILTDNGKLYVSNNAYLLKYFNNQGEVIIKDYFNDNYVEDSNDNFMLIADDIDEIIVNFDIITYLTYDGELFMYIHSSSNENSTGYNVAAGITSISEVKEIKPNHYKIILKHKSKYSKYKCDRTTFLFKENNEYLIVSSSPYGPLLFYFSSHLTIDINDVFVNKTNYVAMIKYDRIYIVKDNSLKPLLSNECSDQTIFYDISYELFDICFRINDIVHIVTYDGVLICKYKLDTDSKVIDYMMNNGTYLFCENKNFSEERLIKHENYSIFNVLGLDFHIFITGWCTFENNSIMIYTTSLFILANYVKYIKTIGKIYVYEFISNKNIKNVKMEYHSMFIECTDKCYFIQFSAYDNPKVIDLELQDYNIYNNLIDRNDDCSESEFTIYVDHEDMNLDKYLNILEMLGCDVDMIIVIMKDYKIHAEGHGVSRNLIYNAMNEFKEKYLDYDMKHFYPKFKKDALKSVGKKAYYLGACLRSAIMFTGIELPFHLPLNFLEAILNKKLSLKHFEIIGKIQDEHIFNMKYSMKDDNEFFEELGMSYEKSIMELCNYEECDIDLFVRGFKHCDIKYLDQMNFMTLDYYLSGDTQLNRSMLRKLFIVSVSTNDIDTDNYMIDALFEKISDSQLSTLIKNATGLSIASTKIEIALKNIDHIKFHTCGQFIDIPTTIWNIKNIDYLIDCLCINCDELRD